MWTLLAALALGATVALLAALISLALSRWMFDSYLQTARTLVERAAADSRTATTLAELALQVEKLDVSFGRLYLQVQQSPLGVGVTAGRSAPTQHGEGRPAPVVSNPFPTPPPLPPPGTLVDSLPEPPGTKAPSVGEQARGRAFAAPT